MAGAPQLANVSICCNFILYFALRLWPGLPERIMAMARRATQKPDLSNSSVWLRTPLDFVSSRKKRCF